jgi:quinol monooxygenase YgiN
MIHVIATIAIKGSRAEFLEILRANVPKVLAEDGCVRYEPAVDTPSGLGPQVPPRDDRVVILESWESLEHLQAHLQAPHMRAYKAAVADLVDGVELQVLEPA